MTIRSKTLQPKDWSAKAPDYIREAKLLGIEIHPPSINKSFDDFSIQDNEIYFGFNAIQGIGKTAAKQIIKARQNKSFEDIYDFLNRVNLSKLNSGAFTSLVLAGAFDRLGYNRLSLYHNINNLYEYVKSVPEHQERLLEMVEREKENEAKTKLIDERDSLKKELKRIEKLLKKQSSAKLLLEYEFIEQKLLEYEKMDLRRHAALKEKNLLTKPELIQGKQIKLTLPEVIAQGHYIGCFINNHPSKIIGSESDKLNAVFAGERVSICVAISAIKEITTKTGSKMAFLNVDDDTGIAEVVAFSNVWANLNKEKLEENRLAYIDGIVEQDEGPIKIKARRIIICEVESIE